MVKVPLSIEKLALTYVIEKSPKTKKIKAQVTLDLDE